MFSVAGPGGGKLQIQGKINTLKTEDNFISSMAIIFLSLNLIFKIFLFIPFKGLLDITEVESCERQDHMMGLTVKVPIPNSV